MSVLDASRREVCLALGAAIACGPVKSASAARTGVPLLWVARRGNSSVHLFPFGEARDGSWFDQRVREAFDSSSALWLELGAPLSAAQQKALHEELGYSREETLFDLLYPEVRARALDIMRELNIPRESIERMKPWLAYYTYVSAFERRRQNAAGATSPQPSPDLVLVNEALKHGKTLGAEYSMEQLLRRLASMSVRLQGDYLAWLFDWFDDVMAGRATDRFGWMQGRLGSRSIVQMRKRYPELYEFMDGERNRWWANKVGELLSQHGRFLVAVGQNHFADPHGILTQLRRLKIVKAADLEQA